MISDDRISKPRLSALLIGPLAALGLAAAAAQERPPEPPRPGVRIAPPDDATATELERARRELEQARRNLEAAARNVAQLSAQSVGPVVREFRRQWLGTGQRSMLGIAITDTDEGVEVSAVSPGGPADEAGIEVGDVIVAIDGTSLTASGEPPSRVLIGRLSDVEPGSNVELTLLSDDGSRMIRVTTRERDRWVRAFEGPGFRLETFTDLLGRSDPWSSLELVPLTPELGAYFGTERGLLVVRAPEDESLMLADGDVIVAIGGREPSSPEHAMRILASYEPGETLELSIMRQHQPQTLRIEVAPEDAERPPRGRSAR